MIVAGELHVGGDAELSRQLFERATLGPFAEDHQPRLAPDAELRECTDQRREVLLGREPPTPSTTGGAPGANQRSFERGRRLLVSAVVTTGL